MPTLITSDDKAKIKRHISQASNKIITAGIARLYVALPGEQRWKDTGLTGAAVLAYDEVGKCFFFKLVDVIGNQGILWDQELYDGFEYHQDRTFFHSFEISNCIAAFSFADEHEARNFYSKVESRQKKIPAKSGGIGRMGSKMKGLFGKSDKQESPSSTPMPQSPYAPQASVKTSSIDPNDPEWAGLAEKLAQLGITEDQIAGNEEFIKSFIASKQAEEPEAPMRNSARQVSYNATPAPRSQAPPPPPPSISVSTPAGSAPGPPPPPPPSTSTAAPAPTTSTPAPRKLPPPVSANTPPMRSLPPPASPVPAAPRDPSPRDSIDSGRKAVPPPPPASRSKNKPPPPPARGTGRVVSTPEPPSRAPALPGKVFDDDKPKFNVPPPFEGVRKTASLSRKVPATPAVPARNGPAVPSRSSGPPVPSRSAGPPVPSRGNDSRPIPPPPSGGIPPPPMPAGGMPPPRKTSSLMSLSYVDNAIAPPMMGSGGPPPPPPPSGPPSAKLDVPTAPGRDDLMASIRAGNKQKLRKAQTVDKSAPVIPGAASSTATPPRGGGPAGGGGNDMASQLAAMLGERNKKVAVHNSDDEDDEEW